MKFAALLGAIALIPVAAVAGYLAHQQPTPKFSDMALQMDIQHVPGQDSDDWIAVAVTGPNKGGAMDVLQALSIYPTHGALEASARGKVKYYELSCQNYTTGASKNPYSAKDLIRKCSSAVKSRKQAEDYMVSLIAPPEKS